ncbi:DUF58 domain-containing protein [Jatrophihabitans telluris]|uniref:DUF58 domain-containing protein n=1 Tax=Jatrophihabitans telluris TaxID=2038343 RepID=A0ABY4QU67_9ACTN|nr:DUF58 domain-containing protein [Jatrophihabitans telluris]UQX87199.1 DUF58 domain-containing protein [Jatrophihabitans telluris]
MAPKPYDAPVAGGAQRIGLSSRGRTFVTVGIISTLAGLVLGVTDLQRVGVLLLALPVPAWLAVRQSRAGLRVSHAVHPERVEVGQRVEVRLTLGNPNAFATGPLRVTETVPGGRPLRFSVAGIRGRQRRTVAYPLPPLHRGRYLVGPTEVTASDPFSLVMANSRSADTAEVIVQPRRDVLAPLTLPMAWQDGGAHSSHSVGSGGSDDASVRDYRYGDDLRKIHWRSSARSGNLMVRQEERPWHGQCLVLLDSRITAYPVRPGERESPTFEWAVSAAASIGTHLAERGRRVLLVTGSGQAVHEDQLAMLDLLADTRPASRADVEPLSDSLHGVGRDASVFAILSCHDRGQLASLAARPRLPGSAVALLIKPWTFEPGWTADGDADLESEALWQEISGLLHANGWRVIGVSSADALPTLWPYLLATAGVRR